MKSRPVGIYGRALAFRTHLGHKDLNPARGLALKMAKTISPDSGEIFAGDGLPQYKKLVFFPLF